jgi:hypothetical protein
MISIPQKTKARGEHSLSLHELATERWSAAQRREQQLALECFA